MIKILIVEDEKPIADLLDMSLTAAGYSCDCLDNGVAAADAVEKKRYDLILLDVMLPGIDGFELMEFLAPLEIPVIFITARSALKDRIRGLKLGADDYIVKPFEMQVLIGGHPVPGRDQGGGAGGADSQGVQPSDALPAK